MKKIMLLILLMVVMLFMTATVSAEDKDDPPLFKIVKLLVINKSGEEIRVSLWDGKYFNQFYAPIVPAGDREFPSEKLFTITGDFYKVQVNTVDGGQYCNFSEIQPLDYLYLDFTTNSKLTIKACKEWPQVTEWNKTKQEWVLTGQEPGMYKLIPLNYIYKWIISPLSNQPTDQ